MNRTIPKIGAAIVTITVILFSLCMIVDFPFGSYFVCMFLPLGYIMMVVGFQYESCEERRVPANVGVAIAVIYAVLILLVYFAQTTSVRLDNLNEQAIRILDFQRGGLLFNYDLLGYGMMALSTLFMGISIKPDSIEDKWLKGLMIVHGIFFVGCFFMPITGVFTNMEVEMLEMAERLLYYAGVHISFLSVYWHIDIFKKHSDKFQFVEHMKLSVLCSIYSFAIL